MGVVRTILLVAFVIVSILAILLVLVQNENSNGMGTAFGGGQSAAFGSHSASVLTRTTGVLVALFLAFVFLLAFLSRGVAGDGGLSATAAQLQGSESATERTGSWIDDEEVPQELPAVIETTEVAPTNLEANTEPEIDEDGRYTELPTTGR